MRFSDESELSEPILGWNPRKTMVKRSGRRRWRYS
jgi:hypothetical protein